MWGAANWNWHTNGQNKLFWQLSPYNGFDMNFPVRGWNECLITYVLAASSPYHAISKEVYDGSWAGSQDLRMEENMVSGFHWAIMTKTRRFPFLNSIPSRASIRKGLKDSLGNDYFEQGKTTLINRAYCIENPHGTKDTATAAGAYRR